MKIPERFHKPTRLLDYDYSSQGGYFVTVVVRNRECCLGSINDGQMTLSEKGRLIVEWWQWLAKQYSYVELGEFVVMPNHIHGIIRLNDNLLEGSQRLPLGRLISAFKGKSTGVINRLSGSEGAQFWQDDFNDRIIRDEPEFYRICEYIINNPSQWEFDHANPECQSSKENEWE